MIAWDMSTGEPVEIKYCDICGEECSDDYEEIVFGEEEDCKIICRRCFNENSAIPFC